MGANRALSRWGWRVLKRDWKQQLMVIVIVTIAATTGLTLAVGALNLTSPNENTYGNNGDSVFSIYENNSENKQILIDKFGSDSAGFIESIEINSGVDTIKAVSMDPNDQITKPFLTLLDGNFPTNDDEVALTPKNYEKFFPSEKEFKSGLTLELFKRNLKVVGLVENPAELSSQFILFRPNFDLTSLSEEFNQTRTDAYVNSNNTFFYDFKGTASAKNSWDSASDRPFITGLVYALYSIALLEVIFLTAASFSVIGQRRVRQFGILGAVGATPRDIRRAIMFNGLSVGIIASLIGFVLSIIILIVSLPQFESLANHRINFTIPWWSVIPGLIMTIVAAVLAAWWPSRQLSKQSIMDSLAHRPPKPKSTKYSNLFGIILSVGGGLLLSFGFASKQSALAVIGVIAAVIGVILFSPVFVSLIGKTANKLPVSARIAARDISRNQSRSAAGIAAIIIALSIPLMISVSTKSSDEASKDETPNLPLNYLKVVTTGFDFSVPKDFDVNNIKKIEADLKNELPNAELTPIVGIIAPPNPSQEMEQSITPVEQVPILLYQNEVKAGQPSDLSTTNGTTERYFQISPIWVATPELTKLFNIKIDKDNAKDKIITSSDEPVELTDFTFSSEDNPLGINISSYKQDLPNYREFSNSWVTQETVKERDWETTTIGWLIKNPEPIESRSIATLQQATNQNGNIDGLNSNQLVIISPQQYNTSNVRLVSTIIGVATAMAILALITSLIRVESSAALRTLSSLGASPRIRRNISAMTAGFLAFSAAILAIPLGYLPLIALASDKFLKYPFVLPWIVLVAYVVGLPLLAGITAWLFSGKEPKKIARSGL